MDQYQQLAQTQIGVSIFVEWWPGRSNQTKTLHDFHSSGTEFWRLSK